MQAVMDGEGVSVPEGNSICLRNQALKSELILFLAVGEKKKKKGGGVPKG